VEFNEAITKNVEVLEPRARALAQDEISRAQALDQKTTGLIAAALVLVAAGVAFASHLNEVSAGTGARTLWGVLIVVLLVLLLASLGLATAVMHPQPFRVAIHKDELEKWATPRFLDRDPTWVLGELMQASVSAIGEAREVNRTKGDRLAIAVRCFAAAVDRWAVKKPDQQQEKSFRCAYPKASESTFHEGELVFSIAGAGFEPATFGL
jgi:hypothetical protein